MKSFLHVGCGHKRKEQTTRGFNTEDWKELRYDIDESVEPDFLGSMTEMASVASMSVEAIFSSHNIEHLYPHEVPIAFGEFLRVLAPDGFVVITCPDLQSVSKLIADGKLMSPAYNSPAGPITPLDILYGHRASMERGNLFMSHRCGFIESSLVATLKASGFKSVASLSRPGPFFDLWAVATKTERTDEVMRDLFFTYSGL